MRSNSKNLKNLARGLRKNMTDADKLLWSKIRRKQINGLQFYRQKVIDNYIVDFYCAQAKLVIEIDGGQHYSNFAKETDTQRDLNLASLGLKVVRYTNSEVLKQIDIVVNDNLNHIESP